VFVDYQQRASEFTVGDLAFPYAPGVDESQAGTVTAVYPAIGRVDIEFAWASGQYGVEDVQRVTDIAAKPPSSENTTTPGGAGTVGVPGGPVASRTAAQALDRVVTAYVKHALYWASKDRHYRGTKGECEEGKYACPKCKRDEEGNPIHLRPTNYKRSEGKSQRLLGCPECLFLIKTQDIQGHADYEDHSEHDHEPGDELVAEWDGTMNQGFDLVQNVKSAAKEEREMVAKFSGNGDGAKSMADMLAYIGKTGGIGHSFEVVVDPGDPDYEKKFGFDGDGSDRVLSVELDGQRVEAN